MNQAPRWKPFKSCALGVGALGWWNDSHIEGLDKAFSKAGSLNRFGLLPADANVSAESGWLYEKFLELHAFYLVFLANGLNPWSINFAFDTWKPLFIHASRMEPETYKYFSLSSTPDAETLKKIRETAGRLSDEYTAYRDAQEPAAAAVDTTRSDPPEPRREIERIITTVAEAVRHDKPDFDNPVWQGVEDHVYSLVDFDPSSDEGHESIALAAKYVKYLMDYGQRISLEGIETEVFSANDDVRRRVSDPSFIDVRKWAGHLIAILAQLVTAKVASVILDQLAESPCAHDTMPALRRLEPLKTPTPTVVGEPV